MPCSADSDPLSFFSGEYTIELIKSIVFKHLKNKNGLCFGQCLTAVGWVGGTLPELYDKDGMV